MQHSVGKIYQSGIHRQVAYAGGLCKCKDKPLHGSAALHGMETDVRLFSQVVRQARYLVEQKRWPACKYLLEAFNLQGVCAGNRGQYPYGERGIFSYGACAVHSELHGIGAH